jgi:murein DD-endopeptidase MepM/ murein hydrolase activator NlpD
MRKTLTISLFIFSFGFVDAAEKIGAVGSSGNALNKAAHLHYSIRSLYPQFWNYKAGNNAALNPQRFLRL